MRPVVSNTSPLTNLAAIGRFDLLRDLFGQIEIAEAVWDELNANGRRWPGRDEVARAPWMRRHTPANRSLIVALMRDLDAGEAATIALAVELNASPVLLDERDGRHFAQRQGLQPMGVIGVLLLAKQRGLLPRVRPCLDALRTEAGFWLGDGIYTALLEQAGELGEER